MFRFRVWPHCILLALPSIVRLVQMALYVYNTHSCGSSTLLFLDCPANGDCTLYIPHVCKHCTDKKNTPMERACSVADKSFRRYAASFGMLRYMPAENP